MTLRLSRWYLLLRLSLMQIFAKPKSKQWGWFQHALSRLSCATDRPVFVFYDVIWNSFCKYFPLILVCVSICHINFISSSLGGWNLRVISVPGLPCTLKCCLSRWDQTRIIVPPCGHFVYCSVSYALDSRHCANCLYSTYEECHIWIR